MRFFVKFSPLPLISLIFFALLVFPAPSLAQDANSILRNVAGSLAASGTFQANFTISSGSSGGMSGKIRYSHPGRIRVDFTNPSGKKIISNGKYLWVYSKNSGSVGRQNVYPKAFSGGLAFLTAYSDVRARETDGGYSLRLTSQNLYWKQVTVRARKDFLPTQIVFSDGRGKSQTIIFSGIKKGLSFPGKIFDFRVPGSMQLVENPLNLK